VWTALRDVTGDFLLSFASAHEATGKKPLLLVCTHHREVMPIFLALDSALIEILP